MTGPDSKLTTDPPLPPGTPDVDELVGDPVAEGGRRRPENEDVDDGGTEDGDDTVTVEPPD